MTCTCFTCDRQFKPLGIARHRAMHRDKREKCLILYSDGSLITHDFSKRKQKP